MVPDFPKSYVSEFSDSLHPVPLVINIFYDHSLFVTQWRNKPTPVYRHQLSSSSYLDLGSIFPGVFYLFQDPKAPLLVAPPLKSPLVWDSLSGFCVVFHDLGNLQEPCPGVP